MPPPLPAVLDVAGIAVEVAAAGPDHAACVTARLGTTETAGKAQLRLEVGPDAPPRPDHPPDQLLEGYAGWSDGTTIWIAQQQATVRVDAETVTLGGPLDHRDQIDTLDNLLQFGISVAVARHDRLMIHGAVAARGGDAVAVIGRSGMGKSTLAAAALVGGWDLLGDDLAVVYPGDGTVRAVQRPPMFPAEIADRLGLAGEREVGGRERVTLPVGVLRTEPARLVGVVTVAHGDGGGGVEELPGSDPGVLDDALAVPPFAPVIRRQLAPAASLVAFPTFVLRHARDPEVRVAAAQRHLDEVLGRCRETAQ